MARKKEHSAQRPAFFTVLQGDFSQNLRVPSAFNKNYNGRLRGLCGLKDPSGERWAVEIERRGKDVFFHKGWERFVKHHSLEIGDILTFTYDGALIFDVKMYGKTLCEKNVRAAERRRNCNVNAEIRSVKLPGRSDCNEFSKRSYCDVDAETRNGKLPRRSDSRVDMTRKQSAEPSVGSIPFESDKSRLVTTLKKNVLYKLNIPKELAELEGLSAGMTIEVQDANGTSWPVKLYGLGDGRLQMRSALIDICIANYTSSGDDVILEFLKPGVVQLHIIKP